MCPTPESLFSAFSAHEKTRWQEQVTKELKGKDPDQYLRWNDLEGLDIPAYYDPSDKTPDLVLPERAPNPMNEDGLANYWEIRQDFTLNDLSLVNRHMLTALEGGVNSVGLKGNIDSREAMLEVFDSIYVDMISTTFRPDDNHREFMEIFLREIKVKNIKTDQIHGCVEFDPLGDLVRTGRWNTSEGSDFQLLEELIRIIRNNLPRYRAMVVNGSIYHEAGATMAQELGVTLAHAHEYLAQMKAVGLPNWAITQSVQVTLASGSAYFPEIAKFRAFRFLWQQLLSYYPAEENRKQALFLHARTSEREMSVYDSYNNLIRGTTQAMSAILGGCDSLSVTPFDRPYADDNVFALRLARNIQILLQDESHLNKVVDPSSGSYYIEQLTQELGRKGWEFFKAIEAEGGYLKALRSGFIQQAIGDSAAKREAAIGEVQSVKVGVNKYPTDKQPEQMPQAEAIAGGAQEVEPLSCVRVSAAYEQNRHATENQASTN